MVVSRLHISESSSRPQSTEEMDEEIKRHVPRQDPKCHPSSRSVIPVCSPVNVSRQAAPSSRNRPSLRSQSRATAIPQTSRCKAVGSWIANGTTLRRPCCRTMVKKDIWREREFPRMLDSPSCECVWHVGQQTLPDACGYFSIITWVGKFTRHGLGYPSAPLTNL